MTSALNPFWGHIANSPFNVAPERAADLCEVLHSVGARFHFDEHDHADMNFHVNVVTKEIRVGARALEALWLHCHVAWLLFKRVSHAGYGSEIDLRIDPEFATPTLLLADAIRAGSVFVLDDDAYARLDPAACKESNEVFLCATGWCLLHEVGHLVCGHGFADGLLPEDRKREEQQADDWAAAWMLDRWKEYNPAPVVFGKRASGAALALLHLASHEVYDRQQGGTTHPDPPDRLYHFVQRHLPPEGDSTEVRPQDVPLHFAVCTLNLYYDHKGIAVPGGPWDTATNCLADMLLALKRHRT